MSAIIVTSSHRQIVMNRVCDDRNVSSSPEAAASSAATCVAALDRRGCRDVSCPRKAQYDLTREPDVERMFADLEPQIVDSSRGGRRGHRCEPRVARPLLLRERDDGRDGDGAGAAGAASRSSSASARSARIRSSRRCRFSNATSGTAIQRKPTPRTASRRRCCSSRDRPIVSSTASTRCICCRSTCTGRTTTSIRPRRT